MKIEYADTNTDTNGKVYFSIVQRKCIYKIFGIIHKKYEL